LIFVFKGAGDAVLGLNQSVQAMVCGKCVSAVDTAHGIIKDFKINASKFGQVKRGAKSPLDGAQARGKQRMSATGTRSQKQLFSADSPVSCTDGNTDTACLDDSACVMDADMSGIDRLASDISSSSVYPNSNCEQISITSTQTDISEVDIATPTGNTEVEIQRSVISHHAYSKPPTSNPELNHPSKPKISPVVDHSYCDLTESVSAKPSKTTLANTGIINYVPSKNDHLVKADQQKLSQIMNGDITAIVETVWNVPKLRQSVQRKILLELERSCQSVSSFNNPSVLRRISIAQLAQDDIPFLIVEEMRQRLIWEHVFSCSLCLSSVIQLNVYN